MGSTERRIAGLLRGIMAAMALVAALLSLTILPARASAAEIIDSGTCGTCPWTVDSDGTLTIGAGRLSYGDWPWAQYSDMVTRVETDGKVVCGESLDGCFWGFASLESADLSSWDTSSVTDATSMFYGCTSLTSLDLSSWDTSSMQDIEAMFSDSGLTSIDLSSWDTSSVLDMRYMFSGCYALTSLDVSEWDTSSVQDMQSMFSECGSLKSLNLTGWDTSSVTDMSDMFYYCDSLVTLDLSSWDTSSVTVMNDMFYDCIDLMRLNVSTWDTSAVTDVQNMFYQCHSLVSVDVSGWDTSSVTNMGALFKECNNLASVDLSGWDTSSVTNMSQMFSDCWSLESLDLSRWDTSSVEDIGGRFETCTSLTSLDVSGWDTSKVKDMVFTFAECSSLTSLDLSGWDTSAVEGSAAMLLGLDSLESFTVGKKYQIKGDGMFPQETYEYGWWSLADQAWYSKDEICANRSGVADTYFSKSSGKAGWKRLAGNGRYDTMAAIVSEGWKGQTGGTVVIATGESFKDALPAAGLAGLDDAPVVLTAGKSLSKQAETQLRSLKPSKVYVAGGSAAVSDGVLTAIQKATGVKPIRVFGQTSASTSAALATAGKGRWDDTAIIATNKSFKDALSVAPLSYAIHWPILLADNGKSLNKDVLKALKECGIKYAYIVGGELAVTKNVENQLWNEGIGVINRLSGANGPATSRAIADFALERGLTAANMAFATSQNFPDALGGAALCGKNQSVLLLCDDKAQANLSFATDHADEIVTGYVFGGEYAFSKGLFDKLPREWS